MTPNRRRARRILIAPVLAAFVAVLSAASSPAETPPAPSAQGEEAQAGDRSLRGDGVAEGAARDRALAKPAARARRLVRLSRLDVAALRREDDAERVARKRQWKTWNRVGIVRDLRPVSVPPSPSRWTRAETLADGSRVFRIEIAAPGAEGLRVRFRAADVPKGSEITVDRKSVV